MFGGTYFGGAPFGSGRLVPNGIPDVDYFNVVLDMNTAMLQFLNAYYATSTQDLAHPLARWLREDSDVPAQWDLIRLAVRGLN